MLVKYCNAECQKKHWPKHKKPCKLRVAELHDDEALFKDPPLKEDCPICFLPMPARLLSCASLPPANISSVPIYDFSIANEGLSKMEMELYSPCCGKTICKGCMYSCCKSGNDKCPFCNSYQGNTTDEEDILERVRKRVEANDAESICQLGSYYYDGFGGLQQDQTRAIELYVRAANLCNSQAHHQLADIYNEGGNLKKAKFHYEAAAMAGDEDARYNLGCLEAQSVQSVNIERAVKHWTIGASAGCYRAMFTLRSLFDDDFVSRESIDSTLAAYNNSCAEMRSEARDAAIQLEMDTIFFPPY